MTSRTFRINEPLVATEKLDNEVMIVNLDLGNYYSLTGSGAVIWDLIAAGHSEASILRAVEQSYAGDAEVIRQGVEDFFSELCAEQLIVGGDGASASPSDSPAHRPDRDRPDFAAPRLDKYTDMQELLLIDPIHEVNDDHGWPKMKP
jgi:hypothetical protein